MYLSRHLLSAGQGLGLVEEAASEEGVVLEEEEALEAQVQASSLRAERRHL